jgi:hypothetical protein
VGKNLLLPPLVIIRTILIIIAFPTTIYKMPLLLLLVRLGKIAKLMKEENKQPEGACEGRLTELFRFFDSSNPR